MIRRGFTLIEAVIAIVVLSLAVPSTMAMIRDATVARAENALTIRAQWIATAVSEQILADAASDDPSLGMSGFADSNAYLNNPGSGLYERLAHLDSDYARFGIEYEVEIRPLTAANGTPSADADENIYRQIEVRVTWQGATGEDRTMPLSFIVTDLTP